MSSQGNAPDSSRPDVRTPDEAGIRKLKPRFLEKPWGSTRTEPWFANSDRKIGEVWFQDSKVALLIKFLFTSEKLSVQVHPDDAVAMARHQSRGKTEMWHILAAQPGAQIAAGFREAITPELARAAAISGEIENLLEWFDAAPGDTFFIPAGTVHAIGAGLVLCEIQEVSDVTYRLYDYRRPRELHLDAGLSVSRLDPYPARQVPRGERLVTCEHFVTELLGVPGRVSYSPAPDRTQLLIVVGGDGQIDSQPIKSGEVLAVDPGVPRFEVAGPLRLLRTWAP